MGLLSWVAVGLVAGLLAQVIMGGGERKGCIVTVILGIIGALVGGFVMGLFGFSGVGGVDLWSIIVATIGAIILLAIGRAIR
ncbi:MAG: GlsB/YeaQ/YmgE family stress response membrane protein [Anaerosomatales bacterium]|nr:GlsB/YeaQ/YmgE family stress response membrane protein [Anaerosomatales bacterium]MDT8434724.1 GlsB/YeaQ/YmgE family stress response membrane protein [Anaerosomatales bacterium]